MLFCPTSPSPLPFLPTLTLTRTAPYLTPPYLTPQGFNVQNDTLTPTFKLRRPQLLKRYQSEVDTMYEGLGEKKVTK